MAVESNIPHRNMIVPDRPTAVCDASMSRATEIWESGHQDRRYESRNLGTMSRRLAEDRVILYRGFHGQPIPGIGTWTRSSSSSASLHLSST